jgi:hypothetical protein
MINLLIAVPEHPATRTSRNIGHGESARFPPPNNQLLITPSKSSGSTTAKAADECERQERVRQGGNDEDPTDEDRRGNSYGS